MLLYMLEHCISLSAKCAFKTTVALPHIDKYGTLSSNYLRELQRILVDVDF